MTARELASLWIIAIAAVFVIVWDYRNQLGAVLSAATGVASPRSAVAATTIVATSNTATTNAASPLAGNEYGFLATYGNPLSGDTQPNGVDTAFGNIFNNLMGQ